MRNGWIFTLAFLILAGGLAFAETTVSITSSPFVLNPAVTTNLSVNFTLTNATFLSGTDTYDIRFYVSDNATFDQGVDTEISGSNTTFASLTCGGDILTSGATCSHSFPIGAQADGSKFVVVVATLNAITPSQTSQSILFDSVAPSASITSPADAAVLATLLPTFTINGDPGAGSNLTIGSFTINGHVHVLTFVSNVATITADPTDGLVVGQTYTASLDTVVDAAGNPNNTPSSITFSISTTAPTNVVASSGASNTYTNDKTPSISVTAEDTISAGGLVA
ncbi:MAG: hypothetical protein AABX02_00025, partial [archaeon]